ncbi:ATP-dependent helicase/deoxyribonuclease subunit B [Clostridia bacterium]|nr:ATP-dependent helicase/deoxyribonuclease subunit B [Clostridia bacterium]
MLNLIIGRSGSGKTHYVQQLLCNLASKNDDKLMMIVPEQLSFETEKMFLNTLGAAKCRNIEVLSFSRMVDFVKSKIGGFAGKVIDDGGRSVLMSLAIEKSQDELTLYKRQITKPELADLMLTAVKEFKMCNISANELRTAADKTDNTTLKQKLTETALITDIYNALLDKSYIDPLDNLVKLSEMLINNKLLNGYTVVVDSFSGFTVSEQLVLTQIMKQASNCYITLCTDSAEIASKSTRFNTTNTTKKLLTSLAKNNTVAVAAPVYLSKNYRTESNCLQAVEENIFMQVIEPFDGNTDGVKLYCAKNIYGEAAYIAQEIKHLVIEKNYRYRDIAIICRDNNSYRSILDITLEKFDIPYFMDKPEEIDAKPLITFVLSAFDVVHQSFSIDSIMRFLKTGFASLNADEIAVLENYCFVWNITDSRWNTPFIANPRGYADSFTEEDVALLNIVEEMRERIITPLIKFKNSIKDANGKGISLAVYSLLQDFNIEKEIVTQAEILKEAAQLEKAKEIVRIWDIFISSLDQTAQLLAEQYITSKRYAELLKTVITSQKISFIPKGLDQVTIGTADRVRLNSPKAVFVIGAIEGEFPTTPSPAGIFSDIERRALIAYNLPLYSSLEDLAVTEQFFAYCAVSSPRNKLYITCYEASLKGEVKTPSTLIKSVQTILPNIKITYEKQENPYNSLWCSSQAFAFIAHHWQDETANVNQLKAYFKEQSDYIGKIETLNILAANKPAKIEDKSVSKKLFGQQMRLSASQVEKFYLCAFQYFCRYGLKAKERKKAQIDSAEYGSLIHFLLEQLLSKNTVESLNLLADNELLDIIKTEMDIYLNSHLGGDNDKSARYLQSYLRASTAAVMLIKHIVRELAQSRFKPIDFELNIGKDIAPYKLALTDETGIVIEGFVDRVDIYKEKNQAYIRIIDYKTGRKKFMLSDVMFGLNLQMLIYLSAIVKNGSKRYGTQLTPAGVLYMPSGESYLNLDEYISEEIKKEKRSKDYRMNGLILDDIEIIKAMEESGAGVYIPVTLKAEKSKKKNEAEPEPILTIGNGAKYTVSHQEMKTIFDKIDDLIANMANNLHSGKIAAVPAKGNYDACTWCPYLHVCGYRDGMESRAITN